MATLRNRVGKVLEHPPTPRYRVAHVDAPTRTPPAQQRTPFGWPTCAIAEAASGLVTTLTWHGPPPQAAAHLRFAVAFDVREEKQLEVALARTGRVLGHLELRYPFVLQPFELQLSAEDATAAVQEGVTLRMTAGELPLWLFAPGESEAHTPPALLPHLLEPPVGDPFAHALTTLASAASLQPFGWMEGCVLDGLYDLAEVFQGPFEQACQEHLERFFQGERLHYEDPRGKPADDTLYGIEATLPFAVVAKQRPSHPVLGQVLTFWQAHQDDEGVIQDGAMTSAEGSYTVAYPLAVIAKTRGDRVLMQLALTQLAQRRVRLIAGGDLYLRRYTDGRRSFRNWARAYAWYLLGLCRTLVVLQGVVLQGEAELDPHVTELRRVAELALSQQRPDGLWSCFLGEPEIAADTSGSAGIAAALALGAHHGLLPGSALGAATRTLQGLETHLTPDGFLTGVAQANRDGEALQRSDYRVIAQMAMGLMGQLVAALASS